MQNGERRCATLGKIATQQWRAGQRDIGRVAGSLLAFMAHDGKDHNPEAFAGALHIAEHFEATKGTYRLLEALIKALAKSKRR